MNKDLSKNPTIQARKRKVMKRKFMTQMEYLLGAVLMILAFLVWSIFMFSL